jgi:arsenite oxidase large subunit
VAPRGRRRLPQLGRRDFTRWLGLGGAALGVGCDGSEGVPPISLAPISPAPARSFLPPPDARVQTSACAFCIVGCGYKIYTWPAGADSGVTAAENALGADFPVGVFAGTWVSPQMHNLVLVGGEPHHVVVLPDPDAEVVNLTGDHTLGGTLARRLPSADGRSERLLRPQLRVGGRLYELPWAQALDLLAGISRHVLATKGPLAWGMKTYTYQFYENTYAITKLAFEAVGTPCWAPHDQPSNNPSTPGLSDAGVDAFSAAYQDWHDADVIFVSGVALYEAKGVLFSQWVQRGGAKLIVVNPQREPTAAYAEANGGLFLQINPGTDALLHHAIARVILENDWHDAEFLAASTVTDEATLIEEGATSGRRRRFGLTFEQYREFVLGDDAHRPENAASIVGVAAESIRRAAELMAAPVGGLRPKTSLMLEKGNIFGHTYANTASFVSLGLLVGAGNRPGRVVSRAGGHQRGMLQAARYPSEKSPDTFEGSGIGLNLDRWAAEGNLAFVWVIGCTWAGGGTAAAAELFANLRARTRGIGPELEEAIAFPRGAEGGLDVEAVLAIYRAKIDAGGMVLAQQDIYPQALTELADLVLPAASWGEANFTRMQGERRLRLYPQICDAPGEAKPDWWVVAQFAQRMGYAGFNWPDANAVFEAAAEASVGTSHDYKALVELAREQGRLAMDALGALGTTGVQCPIKRVGASLEGTVRLHEEGFSTKSKKALFVKGDWAEITPRQGRLAPRAGELWILNRRTSTNWNAMIEDARNPFRLQQLPANLLELNPVDAAVLGVSDGDQVVVETDSPAPDTTSLSFRAVARVVASLRPGVASTYFNYRGDPATAANNAVSPEADPVVNMYASKLGRGRVRRA